jgi:crotonobetainyl-CoA:carnitine CoA-transferase CaiB-like acyl-CoA transferase
MERPLLPLNGLKVLDFSHAADGPMCALMLADAGADVIKAEPLHGEIYRHAGAGAVFYNANRNKRGLALNLQAPEGQEIARRLAAKADVLVESYTPGTAARLGIGYQAISEFNPRIIYCSLSGFGQTGPYSHRPAYDPLTQAMSGFMSITGEPGRPPVRVAPGVIGLGAAFMGAYGILLALAAREKTGRGQLVDVSLFDTAVFFMSPFMTAYSFLGMAPPKMGSGNAMFVPYQCFECSDRYIFIGAANEHFWHGMCSALAFTELENDPRYATTDKRLANRDSLVEELAGRLKHMAAADVLPRLEQAGVPCAPLLEVPEVMQDPQVKSRGMFMDLEYPGIGKTTVANIPVTGTGLERAAPTRAPLIGEHTQEILLGAGYTEEQIDALADKRVILRHGN